MVAEKPKIELRGIEIHSKLSQETPAYTAKLYIDGKYFADVSNEGHGGCDDVRPPRGFKQNTPEFYEAYGKLDALIGETYPQIKLGWKDEGDKDAYMNESLEMLCHGIAWEHLEKRNFKSRLSRTVFMTDKNKIVQFKGRKTDQLVQAVKQKYPDEIVLNCLTFEEAWSIFKDFTKEK